MAYKIRPKYIENQIKEVNDILRERRLKYDQRYDDSLFCWICNHLLEHKWYRGFNMHYDVTKEDGTVIRALAGPDYENKDYYIQIW